MFLPPCQIREFLGKKRLREIREDDATFQKQKTLKAGGRAGAHNECGAGSRQTQSDKNTKKVKVLSNLDVIYTLGSNCIIVDIISYIMKSFQKSLITATSAQ